MMSVSVTAYAADATSGNMTVTYEYTAPTPDPDPDPEPDTSTYILNIPSAVTNDSLGLVELSASKNEIPAGKELVITYDAANSTTDAVGYFKLYKNKGESTQEALTCRILAYSDRAKTIGSYLDGSTSGVPTVAAKFSAGSTAPTYGGFLEFNPLTQNSGVSSGTYTGTVYFNIELRDAN
ncbi:MAG: hypothetical protein ACRKFN_10485 [Desulfitobacterium sp.]